MSIQLIALQAIYDALPKVQCKGKCQQGCGPIGIFPVEQANIQSGGHPIPQIGSDRRWGELTCSALNQQGQCTIYDRRPLICRLFGVVKAMPCPHGCQPERWLTDQEANEIMGRIEKLMPGVPIITAPME